MADSSSTRRAFLAAVGGTALAGCSGLEGFSDGSDRTIPSHRLPDVTDDGDAAPIVVETVPVEIERARLAETTERVTALLGTLPVPFGPEDVPNGHVRQRLVEAATDASDHVEATRTAQSRFTALESVREARREARYAAAGWAFAEGETTKEELQTAHGEAVREAHTVRANHEYLGDDPVTAMLVHARIERTLDSVFTDREPSGRWGADSLLTAAEWGEHAESARALVADSRYLYDRFTASLSPDTGSVAETLSTAAESLSATLQNRRDELPAEPTEGDREALWRLRYDLYDAAESSAKRVAETDRAASSVFAATEGLTAFLAYDRIRGRIEDGEQFRAEDASDVREARSRALDAIRSALDRSSRPELARPVLVDAANTVAVADEQLSRSRGEVQPAQLDEPIGRYTTAQAQAQSVSTASERVLDALET